jgi:hypothetical protein
MCSFLKILLFLFPVCLFGTEPGHVDIVNGRVTITAGRVAIGPQGGGDVLDGLVNRWILDGDALDSAGTNNGTVVSATNAIVDGKGCYAFDPSGSRIIFASGFGKNYGTTNSASLWVKGAAANKVLLGGSAFNEGGYFFAFDGSKVYMSANGTFASVTLATTFSQWTMLSVARDGTGVSFYTNGVRVGATQTLAADTAILSGTIGAYYAGGSQFGGYLRDVRIYRTAVTADNFLAIWNATK